MTELAERFDPKTVEPKWRAQWEQWGIHHFDPKSTKPSFVIDTPPPFTSGVAHMGHALWWIWNDVISRYKRARGFNVLLPQGWDVHGLPTELQVEKIMKVRKSDREKFLKACREWTADSLKKMKDKMVEIGYSADWRYEYMTEDPAYLSFVQKTLLKLHKQGLLRQIDRPVMWCWKCGTTLAKAEVGHRELDGVLYYLKLPLVEGGHLDIATTRPEFLPACVAVFINPKDDRNKKHIGKTVKLPLVEREVPVLANEEVDMGFGTGIVYLCTYGDEADIRWQHKYKLPAIMIIDENGKLNQNAGKYAGLKMADARIKIVEELGMNGFIEKEVPYKHNVLCHTERTTCLNPIEFMPKRQWAIDATKFNNDVSKMAEDIKWYPEHMKLRLLDWTANMDWDWVISRQRVFGTPIPFWYCAKGHLLVPDEKDLPVNPSIQPFPHAKSGKCPEKGCGAEIIGDTDICDGWIDSSVSPLIISGYWKGDTALFKKLYPSDLRQQGHDIIRTWAYYSLLRCYLETGHKPWKAILVNSMILGPDGRIMHKSLGNVVLPDDVLSKHGADTIRAGLMMMGAYTGDVPFSWKDMDFSWRFMQKLWNIARFATLHITPGKAKPCVADRWLLSKMQSLIKTVTENLENYQFAPAFGALHDFVWHNFADDWIEMAKWRLYGKDEEAKIAAANTLYTVLLDLLRLLAPFTPYITEEIYQSLYKSNEKPVSIHGDSWPATNTKLINAKLERAGDITASLIAAIRRWKHDRRLSLNAPLSKLIIEADTEDQKLLEEFLPDISGTVKAAKIDFGKGSETVEGQHIKFSATE